ncbi:MAG: polysaccharide biosynthesis/export family protein, partial [Nitrospinota bacterium]
LPDKQVLKPLTIIREVKVSEEGGRARVDIHGDAPFQYRISSDSRLRAIVVRIPDAVYDVKSGTRKEFPKGPVSRVEVAQREALIKTVEVHIYPRSRLPAVGQDPKFEHFREGPRLAILWRIASDRKEPLAEETKTSDTRTVEEAKGRPSRERGKTPALSERSLQLALDRLSLPRRRDYSVGPKDVLKVTVYRETELSGEFVVAGDGSINYPLLGRVRVEGLTVAQIEKRVETLLAKDYLVNPSLSVKVAEFRSQQIQLLGAVMKPGTYALRGPTTLIEIISQGGGIDPGEGGSKVVVLRPRREKGGEDQFFTVDLNVLLKEADLSENLLLGGNDTVFVPRAGSIFIFGQVKKPGPYKIQERQVTLTEAISMAGGLTRIAAANRTRVVRIEGRKERVINVPLNDILKGDKSKDIWLVAEDVVFVPESFF